MVFVVEMKNGELFKTECSIIVRRILWARLKERRNEFLRRIFEFLAKSFKSDKLVLDVMVSFKV